MAAARHDTVQVGLQQGREALQRLNPALLGLLDPLLPSLVRPFRAALEPQSFEFVAYKR